MLEFYFIFHITNILNSFDLLFFRFFFCFANLINIFMYIEKKSTYNTKTTNRFVCLLISQFSRFFLFPFFFIFDFLRVQLKSNKRSVYYARFILSSFLCLCHCFCCLLERKPIYQFVFSTRLTIFFFFFLL